MALHLPIPIGEVEGDACLSMEGQVVEKAQV